ncbi:MAG: Crp/Fnr family transcriptional regulator [Pseudomonadota bacterium]
MPSRAQRSDHETLFANAPPMVLSRGALLFEAGDAGDHVYLIDTGRIEISRLGSDGQKLISNFLSVGDLVGEIAGLDGGVRTATARALTEARVRVLSGADILAQVQRDPASSLSLIRVLCRRVRHVDHDMLSHATLTMRARLADRLLYLNDVAAGQEGWIKISQSEIADFIGAARESVNKVLNELKDAGLIEHRRGAVRVSSHDALKLMADEG